MYNFRIENAGKLTLAMSIVALLLFTGISATNANALDISNLGEINDLGQSVDCVIVVVGCDGTGSVESRGNTIIGSNNGNNNNTNNNGEEPEQTTTLIVSKIVHVLQTRQ